MRYYISSISLCTRVCWQSACALFKLQCTMCADIWYKLFQILMLVLRWQPWHVSYTNGKIRCILFLEEKKIIFCLCHYSMYVYIHSHIYIDNITIHGLLHVFCMKFWVAVFGSFDARRYLWIKFISFLSLCYIQCFLKYPAN